MNERSWVKCLRLIAGDSFFPTPSPFLLTPSPLLPNLFAHSRRAPSIRSSAFRSLVRSPRHLEKERNRLLCRLRSSPCDGWVDWQGSKCKCTCLVAFSLRTKSLTQTCIYGDCNAILVFMHLSVSSPRGGGGVGHRVGILTFSKKDYQNPHPRAKKNCQN